MIGQKLKKISMQLSPLKITEKGVFLGKLNLLYFWRAQVRARVLFDVKNEFVNGCRVVFHFESLYYHWTKIEENIHTLTPPPEKRLFSGGLTILKDVIFGFVSR